MSDFNRFRTDFPTIRHRVSPMPIGIMPGFLSKGMSLSDVKGSMNSVHKRRVITAMEWHMLFYTVPKGLEQSIRGHMSESMPDGSAEPFAFLAVT